MSKADDKARLDAVDAKMRRNGLSLRSHTLFERRYKAVVGPATGGRTATGYGVNFADAVDNAIDAWLKRPSSPKRSRGGNN